MTARHRICGGRENLQARASDRNPEWGKKQTGEESNGGMKRVPRMRTGATLTDALIVTFVF